MMMLLRPNRSPKGASTTAPRNNPARLALSRGPSSLLVTPKDATRSGAAKFAACRSKPSTTSARTSNAIPLSELRGLISASTLKTQRFAHGLRMRHHCGTEFLQWVFLEPAHRHHDAECTDHVAAGVEHRGRHAGHIQMGPVFIDRVAAQADFFERRTQLLARWQRSAAQWPGTGGGVRGFELAVGKVRKDRATQGAPGQIQCRQSLDHVAQRKTRGDDFRDHHGLTGRSVKA